MRPPEHAGGGISPPIQRGVLADEAALLTAAHRLAGYTVAELARAVCQGVPSGPVRDKGLIGRVAERALGLHLNLGLQPSAADFGSLGIELKTLPVTRELRPRESTFVCYVPLLQLTERSFEESRVAQKLARVLFLPVESGRALSFEQRRIGRAFLWSPSVEQREWLRADYAELARRVLEGHVEALDARVGRVLQLRPKAAHGGVRVRMTDGDGAPWRLQPRGFYLRASFTKQLLDAALDAPG
ncbi:MAG: MutH/Sau3AI family endonuclease [Polyangiales bacterium]